MKRRQLDKVIIKIFALFILPPFIVSADWIGPKAIIAGQWGKETGQFYYESQDMFDAFPKNIGIDKNNNILISDEGNKRIYVYDQNGKLINIIQKPSELSDVDFAFGRWPGEIILLPYNNLIVISCDYKQVPGGYQPLKQCVIDYKGTIILRVEVAEMFAAKEGLFLLKNNKYYHYSITGESLKTYDSWPMELGLVKEEATKNDITKLTIEYPEKKYSVEIQEYSPEDKISRDILGNLYVTQRSVKIINKNTDEKDYIQHYIVNRIDNCTNSKILFDMPGNKHEVVGYDVSVGIKKKALELYGEPVISPSGDVYTWRYTPEKYSILKWTWQGPEDAPQSLQISVGLAGLKLDWQKPVKDTNTVICYQILRSTEVCGPFNEVTTVKKDKLVFEDTTIKPPWKYYYVVKAVRDKKFSGESNKVYMQWK